MNHEDFKSILVIYPELQAKRKSKLFLDEDEDIKRRGHL